MKELKDMTLTEVVDRNAGEEIIAIGTGGFREAVYASALRLLEWNRVVKIKKEKKGKRK